MRARKNTPTEHIDAPQIIAGGTVNLVNGYITTAEPSSMVESPAQKDLNIYTLDICVDGVPKKLDVFIAKGPY